MPLRTREQALKAWYEDDQVTFFDLLSALEQCKDITTEYGLNITAHESWRLGDPHKKTAVPDRHDYPIAHDQGIEVVPGPDWRKLFRWLISQRTLFLPYHTVYLVTDNRDLQSDEVQTTPGLEHWPKVAAWWQERIRYVGPYGELTTVVFVHISEDTGLDRVHPTWAGTYVLDACVFLFPSINFGLIDSDCVPVTLFEVRELWWSSTDSTQPVELLEAEQTQETGSLAHSHKRARSVDTGRDMQQPGPPSKLSRSLSAGNLDEAAQVDINRPTPVADDLAAEVDYGSSPERSPPKKSNRTPSSTDSSPTRSHRPPPGSKKQGGSNPTLPLPKGVILVSEAFTEINAGLVIVLASMHTPPVPSRVFEDPDLDPDEAVGAVVKAYHMHVEAYLATTFPPVNVEQWVASGLLGSPLLGTATTCTADWCHAWSILGQWSGHVTFPVPASRVWPRHGHLRKILDAGRQPNFHKWARPAFEQGALPTLSMLPGNVAVRVLPGDKMYQAMTIEQNLMRPAILHGFGTSAKKQFDRLGTGRMATTCCSPLWEPKVAAAVDASQFPASARVANFSHPRPAPPLMQLMAQRRWATEKMHSTAASDSLDLWCPNALSRIWYLGAYCAGLHSGRPCVCKAGVPWPWRSSTASTVSDLWWVDCMGPGTGWYLARWWDNGWTSTWGTL